MQECIIFLFILHFKSINILIHDNSELRDNLLIDDM